MNYSFRKTGRTMNYSFRKTGRTMNYSFRKMENYLLNSLKMYYFCAFKQV
jgi:hypothetical protein